MARIRLDDETKKWYAKQALKWCELNFGFNERKRTRMTLDITERSRKIKNCIVYGNYCFYRNRMTIYLPNNKTIHDIVSTVIHEYTHYLQVRRRYREYEISVFYSQNPFEKQAKRNEEKYTKMCIKDIKKISN
jgi:uncharacterized protein YjaZ